MAMCDFAKIRLALLYVQSTQKTALCKNHTAIRVWKAQRISRWRKQGSCVAIPTC